MKGAGPIALTVADVEDAILVGHEAYLEIIQGMEEQYYQPAIDVITKLQGAKINANFNPGIGREPTQSQRNNTQSAPDESSDTRMDEYIPSNQPGNENPLRQPPQVGRA